MGHPPIKPPSSRRDNPDYNNHTLPPPQNTPKSPAPKAYCKAWARGRHEAARLLVMICGPRNSGLGSPPSTSRLMSAAMRFVKPDIAMEVVLPEESQPG